MGFNMNMVAATVVLGVSLGVPLAEVNETEELAKIEPLPISMSMAVEAAEAAAPGQAIIAQLDIAQGRPVYEIHILGRDHSLSKVQVDAQDGEVLVMGEDPEQTRKEQMVHPDQGGAI